MSWWAIIALAAGSYGFKAFGLLGLSRVELRGPLADLVRFLPAAMFAGLIVQNVLADGTSEIVVTRALGVAAGGLAVWAKAPLLVVILVAAGVAAGTRAIL